MEEKIAIFKRVPPGDNWRDIDSHEVATHGSLTDAIESYFQRFGNGQYYIDAAKGLIYRVIEVDEPPKPEPRYSIYGDYEYDG